LSYLYPPLLRGVGHQLETPYAYVCEAWIAEKLPVKLGRCEIIWVPMRVSMAMVDRKRVIHDVLT